MTAQLRIEQRTFLTPSRRKLDVNIVQSNYHIEITPRCVPPSLRRCDCARMLKARWIVRSDLGNYDRAVVQEVLKDIAQTQQVDLNARKRFKGWSSSSSPSPSQAPAPSRLTRRLGTSIVVIINEADGMSRDAQSALRRTMEKYTSSLRVILCANSTSKIIGPIRSRCLLLRVGAPSEEQVRKAAFVFSLSLVPQPLAVF